MRFMKILMWIAISLLGATAVAVAGLSRGEPINSLWLVVAGVCTFAVAYRFYASWLIAKVLTVDDMRAPAAVTRSDGKDFVPTPKWVVFGHHFAAIAGPGPLVGPVLAAQFGYLPGTLWILIGAALGGGVHDAIVLFASMRRDGKSLGQMLKEEINPVVGMIAMFSLLAIMTILLAVLGLVVVKALAHSPWGLFTIACTIPLAMVMGVAIKSGKFGVTAVSVAGVIGLLLSVVGGKFLPPSWNAALTLDATTLAWAIMIYGFAAAVLPVWLLLAPRDYLSTFMKLGTVAVLAIFIVFLAPQLQMPAITPFIDGSGFVVPGPVFPFVCITIACGAISGFHALISSGTTPKLLAREKEIKLVGYGAMVVEMLVALMAIIAASVLPPGQYFAINSPIDPRDPVAVEMQLEKINNYGPEYAVTLQDMEIRAEQLQEPTMIGKAGGAPTFAVGMAVMFQKVFKGKDALALWYHFAIMFEALFILHARCRNARWSFHSPRLPRHLCAQAQGYGLMGCERIVNVSVSLGMGLFPLPRCQRSRRYRQESVADFWDLQSIARRHCLLPRHHDSHQDGQGSLLPRHPDPDVFSHRRHLHGRMDENFLTEGCGLSAWHRKITRLTRWRSPRGQASTA